MRDVVLERCVDEGFAVFFFVGAQRNLLELCQSLCIISWIAN
jgi:hypothetical protein